MKNLDKTINTSQSDALRSLILSELEELTNDELTTYISLISSLKYAEAQALSPIRCQEDPPIPSEPLP